MDLAASFSVDALVPLLADKETQEKLKPFLPAVENLSGTEQEIKETVQSAQYKQVSSSIKAFTTNMISSLRGQAPLPFREPLNKENQQTPLLCIKNCFRENSELHIELCNLDLHPV